MFSRITGKIVERSESSVLLETASGLGYDIFVPPCVHEKLHAVSGTAVTLQIYSTFALEGNSGRFTFFGFTNAVERDFFEALVSVASIGPKTAARAFSKPMAAIARAIDNADYGFLVKLPGIGQQKARDIVAKLQGKVTRFLLIQDAPERPLVSAIPDFAQEALDVLVQLEYKRNEAEILIARTLEKTPTITDTETLLAQIYRTMHTAMPV